MEGQKEGSTLILDTNAEISSESKHNPDVFIYMLKDFEYKL